MPGADEQQPILVSSRAIEDRIPAEHPLRAMLQHAVESWRGGPIPEAKIEP